MNQHKSVESELELLLNDVSQGMEAEVEAIGKQIDQIKGLLVDAIEELHDSFAGIDEHSGEQMKLFGSFFSDLAAVSETPINIFQHVEQTERALSEMLEMLVQESREDLVAVGRMNEAAHAMHQEVSSEKQVAGLLAEIEALTRAELPDIARIQALVVQAGALNAEVVAKGEELARSCAQSRNAVERLASRDMENVYAAKASVDQILDHLNHTNLLISDCRGEADRVNAELKRYLGSAIRALQFEDIVSQSLGHT